MIFGTPIAFVEGETGPTPGHGWGVLEVPGAIANAALRVPVEVGKGIVGLTINSLPLEGFLEFANMIVARISHDLADKKEEVHQHLGELAVNFTKAVFWTLLDHVGEIPVLRDGVLSNLANRETLELVWVQRETMTRFLLDIIECTKGFVRADGERLASVTELELKYNEMDIAKPMNLHAIISQTQRFIKSLIPILCGSSGNSTVGGIKMDAKLDSDTTETTYPKGKLSADTSASEHWLFVNGIAGEYTWLRDACKKLDDSFKFGRETVGIFNRGDGVLWDLIECGGQRTASGQGDLIEQTASSMQARASLREALEYRLMDGQSKPVVVVAHSQGCLVTRLVLEDLITGNDRAILGPQMRRRLYVFTFGNPSIHWKVEGAPTHQALKSFCRRTEHFANRTDYVASLGVLRQPTAGNDTPDEGFSNVFVNEVWKGHLFGAQYGLEAANYMGGQESWLLSSHGRAIGPP